jgi:hypothetical protein
MAFELFKNPGSLPYRSRFFLSSDGVTGFLVTTYLQIIVFFPILLWYDSMIHRIFPLFFFDVSAAMQVALCGQFVVLAEVVSADVLWIQSTSRG